MLKKRKFLVGGLILLIAISYLGYTGFQSSATYYYTVSEILTQESSVYGEKVRVNGLVAPESVQQDTTNLVLRFTVTEGEKSLPVIYQGVVPDAFKVGNEVVVEGYLNADGILQANAILTKCPSRYVPKE